jgi:exopolysaccharide production protein ExoZ
MTAKTSKIESIQMLRAFAASLVVIGHLLGNAAHKPELFGYLGTPHFGGGVGVDVFFLISGFIMVFASSRLFGSLSGSREFLVRRLIRIIPLY